MANKKLHDSSNTSDKNLFLVINHQGRKYRIAVLFKAIGAPDFNTLFIYLLKYYIQYIIGI